MFKNISSKDILEEKVRHPGGYPSRMDDCEYPANCMLIATARSTNMPVRVNYPISRIVSRYLHERLPLVTSKLSPPPSQSDNETIAIHVARKETKLTKQIENDLILIGRHANAHRDEVWEG